MERSPHLQRGVGARDAANRVSSPWPRGAAAATIESRGTDSKAVSHLRGTGQRAPVRRKEEAGAHDPQCAPAESHTV